MQQLPAYMMSYILPIEGDDFTAVPSGAVLGDSPPRYQTVTFAPNSTTLEICVNIAPDRLACEEEEMFQIELSSADACGGMNFTYLLVSIEDSTRKMFTTISKLRLAVISSFIIRNFIS